MKTNSINKTLLFVLAIISHGCDSGRAAREDGGPVDAQNDTAGGAPCAELDLCACRARSDCLPEFDSCVCDCVDYSCADCPAEPAECACGGGAFVRCVEAKKANGELCAADDACRSGFCYSDVQADGSFSEQRCHAVCIGEQDYSVACYDDAHCCAGRCCVGCGEREGLCLVE